ncbi:hypothetical protein [Fodinicurvata sp. EGI_FJ10296]|uniref:hypothetical protein n=1 Tax=Fodinicurvata sp. EGI_FJ10296 TaxID=3231908 RepID=UPI003456E263
MPASDSATAEIRPNVPPMPAAQLSEDYLHRIVQETAEATARRAVADVLERLGFDAQDPRSVRQDADWLREARLRSSDPEYQKDRQFLRRQRETHEAVGRHTRRAILTTLIGGTITAMILGLQEMLR